MMTRAISFDQHPDGCRQQPPGLSTLSDQNKIALSDQNITIREVGGIEAVSLYYDTFYQTQLTS